MLFKVYDKDGNKIFANSIRELAETTGSTLEQARQIYYKRVGNLNGFEVIKL